MVKRRQGSAALDRSADSTITKRVINAASFMPLSRCPVVLWSALAIQA
jgi:hypothetical protein